MSQIKSLISSFSLCLLLSACGFQPLYLSGQGQTVYKSLQQIYVGVIADRPGQILRNYLLMDLPTANESSSRYHLKVTLSETTRKLGFRLDKTPRHSEIIIVGTLSLVDTQAEKTVYTDKITSVASFSLGSVADFASYSARVAEESARDNALKVLAEDIKLSVASYLSEAETDEG